MNKYLIVGLIIVAIIIFLMKNDFFKKPATVPDVSDTGSTTPTSSNPYIDNTPVTNLLNNQGNILTGLVDGLKNLVSGASGGSQQTVPNPAPILQTTIPVTSSPLPAVNKTDTSIPISSVQNQIVDSIPYNQPILKGSKIVNIDDPIRLVSTYPEVVRRTPILLK